MNRRSEAPRRVDQPEPGFFTVRKVRGGPFVAARIYHEGGLWMAEVDGEACGLPAADPAYADGVFRIWTSGRRITEREALVLLGTKAWALNNAPDHPAARPDEPIDLNTIRPVW